MAMKADEVHRLDFLGRLVFRENKEVTMWWQFQFGPATAFGYRSSRILHTLFPGRVDQFQLYKLAIEIC